MINNHWVFGNQAGLDFSNASATTKPIAVSGNLIGTSEGCASVSDNNGNLLFYTDGRTIWDATNTVRANTLLGDSSSSQSSIIVPNPGNHDEYYVFTMDGSSSGQPPFNHFNGVLVNVTTWSITPIGMLFTLPNNDDRSPAEKITAVQQKSCSDFWVITGMQIGKDGTTTGSGVKTGQGVLRVFSVTAAGLSYAGETILPKTTKIGDWGYLRASADGRWLAIATGNRTAKVLIYPFDKTTGVIDVAGEITIPRPNGPDGKPILGTYGIEFSPDNKLLYFTGDQHIFQVEINTPTPSASIVGTVPDRRVIGALQRGPDDRIYVAIGNSKDIVAILSPNVVGQGCNVDLKYITLVKNSTVSYGLPNLLPDACEENNSSGCDCNDCTGCNEDAEAQNEALIERAQEKFNTLASDPKSPAPFQYDCKEKKAVSSNVDFTPHFYFHWGDGKNDQFETHDTEVFYLTVCNPFEDVRYEGLRITKVTLLPDIHPLDKIHIVPDRFISLDCLEPCSCQTREFALITRANDTAGKYTLDVEYCYEGLSIPSSGNSGTVSFPLEIVND